MFEFMNEKDEIFFVKFKNLNLYPDLSVSEDYSLDLEGSEKYLTFPSGEKFLIIDFMKISN